MQPDSGFLSVMALSWACRTNQLQSGGEEEGRRWVITAHTDPWRTRQLSHRPVIASCPAPGTHTFTHRHTNWHTETCKYAHTQPGTDRTYHNTSNNSPGVYLLFNHWTQPPGVYFLNAHSFCSEKCWEVYHTVYCDRYKHYNNTPIALYLLLTTLNGAQ